MAIGTPVTGAVASSSAAQTLEVALPATVNDGDYLTIHCFADDNVASACPEAGWTEHAEVPSTNGGDSMTSLYGKVAASESGTYTITFGGGIDMVVKAFMVAWPGVDQTTSLDAAVTESIDIGLNSDTAATGAITTVTNGAAVISQIGSAQTTASPGTVPSGYTKVGEDGTTDYLGVAYKIIASFGLETPGTWSGLGTGADSGGLTFALRPAAAAASSIMNQIQGANLGSDLFNGTIL